MASERVLLIGPRGAGKSEVGARLARRLRISFLDVDFEVEEETGRRVSELLADGALRSAEGRVLVRLLAGEPAVVATGGGAVFWEGLAEAASGWRVVWLDAAPDVLAARIRADPNVRPSLTGRPADEEIEAVARERATLYAAAAWRRVDTSERDPDEVVEQIEKLLRDDDNAETEKAD